MKTIAVTRLKNKILLLNREKKNMEEEITILTGEISDVTVELKASKAKVRKLKDRNAKMKSEIKCLKDIFFLPPEEAAVTEEHIRDILENHINEINRLKEDHKIELKNRDKEYEKIIERQNQTIVSKNELSEPRIPTYAMAVDKDISTNKSSRPYQGGAVDSKKKRH